MDIVEKIKNKQFSLSIASLITIIGLLTTTIWFFVENKSYKETIKKQSSTINDQQKIIEQQGKSIATLQGSMETVNNTIKAFTENPPSELDAKISNLREIVKLLHGGNVVNNNWSTNNTPTSAPPIDTVSASHATMGSSGETVNEE